MRTAWNSLLLLFLLHGGVLAQVRVQWMDSTFHGGEGQAIFFTNRRPKSTGDGSVAFRNSWTRQTGSLWFCRFDYGNDAIIPLCVATKTCEKQCYPAGHVEGNPLYRIDEELRLKRGIKHITIMVPGYARTFHNQVHQFMKKVQQLYADAYGEKGAFITFAWSDQAMPLFYYKGKRAANRAANDFSIFQHMLEEFLADSAWFASHPGEVYFNLVCFSMGGQMLKRYLVKRDRQGIETVPVYSRTLFLVSDASDDSFQEGRGLDRLLQVSDSILVVVNRRDGLLRASLWANMETRLGLSGPRNLECLPDKVVVWDVTRLISWKDLGTLGHCYFFRNPVMVDSLAHLLTGQALEIGEASGTGGPGDGLDIP